MMGGEGGGRWGHDCLCLRVSRLKMVAGKIINNQKREKKDSKKWLQRRERVDEVTHRFEDDDGVGGVLISYWGAVGF